MNNIRENDENMKRIINSIANAISSVLPDSWTKVAIGYFFDKEKETNYHQINYYKYTDDELYDLIQEAHYTNEYDDAVFDITDSFEELHDICKKVGDDWDSATFILERDGSFNMDYDYSPVKNYNMEYIRTWQCKYL